jgi:hypothetical protein
MRALFTIVVGLFAAIGVVAVALFMLAHYEQQASEFATYDDLKASGLIEKGWIPSYIPTSARNISESHDVSANSGGAAFTFDPADTALTNANCTLLSKSSKGAQYLCPPFEGSTFIVVLRNDGRGSWSLIHDAI